MKTYVLGFAFNAARKRVTLIEKQRPDWQKGKYNGIGGKIEPGEQPRQAMAREYREEAGVDTREEDWKLFAVLRSATFVVYVMRITLSDEAFEEVWTCTDEHVAKFPVNYPDLRSLALSNVPWLLNAALDEDAGRMVIHAEYGEEGEDLGESLLTSVEALATA